MKRRVFLIEPGYFSAKDAKNAKIYCNVILPADSNNHCGKFSDQAGLNSDKSGFSEYSFRDDTAATCIKTTIPETFRVFGVISGK